MAHTAEKEAEVAIPENLIDRVRTGKRVADALGEIRSTSTSRNLRELAPAADPATRTYRARYSLADAAARSNSG